MRKKHNILIIQPIASFSGSLKSLEQYLRHMHNNFNFTFLTQNGPSAKTLKKYGKVYKSLGLTKFDNTLNSHYSGYRWILLIREFFYIPFSILSLLKIKYSNEKINLIHLNEITGLPTAILAKLIFNTPLIVHVRSLNNLKRGKLLSNYFLKILNRFADKILVIDNEVLKSLNSKNKCTIARNILDTKKIKTRSVNDNNFLHVGYIGTFLKYKGVENLIEAVDTLTKKNYKIKLILAGSFLKRNFLTRNIFKIFNFENNIKGELLEKEFIINLGFLKDIRKFYEKIDILCFPSSLNTTGRQVFEAGFFTKPVIICLKNKNSDGFVNYYNGISYKHFNSIKELQNSIIYFYNNRKKIKTMGLNGKKIAVKNNSKDLNIKKMNAIYNGIINNNIF